jgi:hypothetical protein
MLFRGLFRGRYPVTGLHATISNKRQEKSMSLYDEICVDFLPLLDLPTVSLDLQQMKQWEMQRIR